MQKIRKKLVNEDEMAVLVNSISKKILEANPDKKRLAIVGIHTRGAVLAKRIMNSLQKISGIKNIPYGELDITLYRDDLSSSRHKPVIKGTKIDFDINGKTVILIDDVLYTGRTIRAALDELVDFGRPASIQLAVLIDRGHREFPIRADYAGKTITTEKNDMVRVRLKETDQIEDVVMI